MALWYTILWITQDVVAQVSIVPKIVAGKIAKANRKLPKTLQNKGKTDTIRKMAKNEKNLLRVLFVIRRTPFTGGAEARLGRGSGALL
ncbi:hypothetical protein, partial [Yoonia litorea]|uniref:hypothetical protein n=1 Tax=Yoonia litorea TaxID=1123755 RepID=UPI001041FB3F